MNLNEGAECEEADLWRRSWRGWRRSRRVEECLLWFSVEVFAVSETDAQINKWTKDKTPQRIKHVSISHLNYERFPELSVPRFPLPVKEKIRLHLWGETRSGV